MLGDGYRELSVWKCLCKCYTLTSNTYHPSPTLQTKKVEPRHHSIFSDTGILSPFMCFPKRALQRPYVFGAKVHTFSEITKFFSPKTQNSTKNPFSPPLFASPCKSVANPMQIPFTSHSKERFRSGLEAKDKRTWSKWQWKVKNLG